MMMVLLFIYLEVLNDKMNNKSFRFKRPRGQLVK